MELRGCPRSRALWPGMKPASEADYATEYLDLILSVKVVAGLDDWPPTDLRAALDGVRRLGGLQLLAAPASARRVHDLEDLRALEAVTRR